MKATRRAAPAHSALPWEQGDEVFLRRDHFILRTTSAKVESDKLALLVVQPSPSLAKLLDSTYAPPPFSTLICGWTSCPARSRLGPLACHLCSSLTRCKESMPSTLHSGVQVMKDLLLSDDLIVSILDPALIFPVVWTALDMTRVTGSEYQQKLVNA
nr:hypothetical protein Iba_chr03aCG0780 [Ipomoea batatas]